MRSTPVALILLLISTLVVSILLTPPLNANNTVSASELESTTPSPPPLTSVVEYEGEEERGSKGGEKSGLVRRESVWNKIKDWFRTEFAAPTLQDGYGGVH